LVLQPVFDLSLNQFIIHIQAISPPQQFNLSIAKPQAIPIQLMEHTLLSRYYNNHPFYLVINNHMFIPAVFVVLSIID
jgi:hypothetical protein